MTSSLLNSTPATDIAYQNEVSEHQKSAIGKVGTATTSFLICQEFNDVDELSVVSRQWDLDFRQLNRGGFCGSVVQAGNPQLQIVRTRLQGVIHQNGSGPVGLRTFALSTDGHIDLSWRGHQVESNSLLLFPKSRELESTSHPDFDMLLVSVPEESLENACRQSGAVDLERLIAEMEIVTCQNLQLASLRRWIRRALVEVARDPALLDDAEFVARAQSEASDRILRAMITSRIDFETHRSGRRRRLVEHAVRLARDRAVEIHTVADLSRQSGASVRTLRRGFQERFGVSPKTYLQAQRLTGVRRDLRFSCNHSRVTDVANKWGFWHMGQFAVDYRKMFEELPSQTLESAGNDSKSR